MPRTQPAVLPVAFVAIRILIIVNFVAGGAILALLGVTFWKELWAMKALGIAAFPDPHAALTAMRAIAALGIVAAFLNYGLLQRLVAMVETVRRGDPFVAENARRLQAIAWVLLGLQLLSIAIAAIASTISRPGHPFHVDAGVSVSGWLAVILTFVLARVFAEGALMREELEGTV
jgi:hypothetical protein